MDGTGFGKLVEVIGGLHRWPIVLAILLIGIVGVVEMVSLYVFRVAGGLSEAYYGMRIRLHTNRQKFEDARRGTKAS
jgi:hypothetical protein